MKKLFYVLIIIMIFSCSNSEKNNFEQSEIIVKEVSSDKIEIDSLTMSYFNGISQKWSDGRFLKYFCKNENLFVEYGNYNFKKTVKDTFDCIAPPTHLPYLWKENNDFLLLKFGCGSPCWGTLVLPFDKQDSIQTYMYQYEFDELRNVLIYLDYEQKNERSFLVAKNLKTKEIEEIAFEGCDDVAFMGYCIDSISYDNGQLYLQTKNREELEEGMNSNGSNILRKKLKI